MARNLSEEMRRALFARETGETGIALLTIDHPDIPEGEGPIRISTDATERYSDDPPLWRTMSRGAAFKFLPVRVVLPDEKDGRAPEARLAIDNIGREMIALLRSINTPATLLIELVLKSSPDLVEASFPDYQLVSAAYNAQTIEFIVTLDGLATEPFGFMRFTPSRFPGLFNNAS